MKFFLYFVKAKFQDDIPKLQNFWKFFPLKYGHKKILLFFI